MEDYTLFVFVLTIAASFALSYVTILLLKAKLLKLGIGGIDINKLEKPNIPESGGVLILPALWAVTLLLVYLRLINPVAFTFLFTTTCFAMVGFFDDGFKVFKRGERWLVYSLARGAVLLFFTVPFAYLNFGVLSVLPFSVIIILSASLANSFAGLNGWEVGSSLVLLCGITVMLLFAPRYTTTLLCLAATIIGAVFALFLFNKYPARIFPGDSGTLLMGSFAGCLILFIDHWYLALPLFLPHFFDIYLKAKTNRSDMSQKREKPYELRESRLHVPPSGKLDFVKWLIRKSGPMTERKAVRQVWYVVITNTFVWVAVYITIKLL